MGPKPPDEIARVHVWVKGRVQGVGFRAHVAYSAQSIGVAGWVRNVGWDQVETIAQGPRPALEVFVEAVKAGPRSGLVGESRVEWETPSDAFDTFEIRHSQ